MQLELVTPALQEATAVSQLAAIAGVSSASLWCSLPRPDKVDLSGRGVALRSDATGTVTAEGRSAVLSAMAVVGRGAVVALTPASAPAGTTLFLQCSGRRKVPAGAAVAVAPAAPPNVSTKPSKRRREPRDGTDAASAAGAAPPGRQCECVFPASSEEERRCRADDPLKWCGAPTVTAAGVTWHRPHPHVIFATLGAAGPGVGPGVTCLVGAWPFRNLTYSRGDDEVQWAPGVIAAVARAHDRGAPPVLLLQLPHLHRATQWQLDDAVAPLVAALRAVRGGVAVTVVAAVVSLQQASPFAAPGLGLWDIFAKHCRPASGPVDPAASCVVGDNDAAAVAMHSGLPHRSIAEFEAGRM